MKARKLDLDEDYPVLYAWWQLRDRPCPDRIFLPETGIMIQDNQNQYCAGFLHETKSNFAFIGNISSNPNTAKELRSNALDMMIYELITLAISLGYKLITGSSNHPALQQRYRKLGFKGYDEGIVVYGRDLRCQQ